jgi:glycosyltransferase involved in cell wall biosynthesis
MIENITPLILTFNEAPNIGRTLAQLRWARQIVVVDSFSEDETVEIASSFPNVRVVQRKFDDHGAQWSFGVNQTEISTEWILALDADYILTSKYIEELKALVPASQTNGFQARFTYCINGRRLRSGVYPPVTVLYRRAFAEYSQDGHTQRLKLAGEVDTMQSPILHDDRKPLKRWFESQQRYMALEAKKILASDPGGLGRADRIRRWRVIAPVAVLVYCLLMRGGVLDGWAGFYYAGQRVLAELLLSLYLIESDFDSLGRRRERKAVSSKREASTEKG